jgi:hypothetical protein
MNSLNDDLIGGEVNPLADALRTARTRIEALTQTHRQYSDALGHIAAAAGLLDFHNLDELVAGVIAQLNISALTAPLAESPTRPLEGRAGLVCEACGEDGAVDMDGAVLCSACSGEDMLAEGLPT